MLGQRTHPGRYRFHAWLPLPARGRPAGLVLTVPLCARLLVPHGEPSCSAPSLVSLCRPGSTGPRRDRERRPSSRDSWTRPSFGTGFGVSAALGFLAEGLNLAAESIKKEFLFCFCSLLVGARLTSLGTGILGAVPHAFLQMPLSTPGPAARGCRTGRSRPSLGGEPVWGEGSASPPGQALQETLISLPRAALPEPGRGPSRCHLEATGRAVRQPESSK